MSPAARTAASSADARDALAVVLEVRLETLQGVQVLVALALDLVSVVEGLGGSVTHLVELGRIDGSVRLARCHRLAQLDLVAHASSTISASTMSSSSPAGAAGSLALDFAASS